MTTFIVWASLVHDNLLWIGAVCKPDYLSIVGTMLHMPTCLCLRQSVIKVVAHNINICLWLGLFCTWLPVYDRGIVEYDYLYIGDCLYDYHLQFCSWLSVYDWDYFVHDYLSMIGTTLYMSTYLWLGLFCTWLPVYDWDYFVHDYLSMIDLFCTCPPVYDSDYFVHDYLSMIGTVSFMNTCLW